MTSFLHIFHASYQNILEMLVLLSLLLSLSVFHPATGQEGDGGSPGTATAENAAPSQESERASSAEKNGILERNPKCDKQGCTTNLTCIDYGRIFAGVETEVKVCDCTTPVGNDCYCVSESVVYRRWQYQEKPKPKPSLPEGANPPKAGYSRPGCYLEYGETCNLIQVDNEATETHNLCKHGLYCKAIKGSDMWGYCISFGLKAATPISSQLSLSLLMFIHVLFYLC